MIQLKSCVMHIGIISGCVVSPTHALEGYCDEQTSRVMAKAYVLSLPLIGDPKALETLIMANRPHFLENGVVTRCMRIVGEALMRRTIAQHQGDGQNRAEELFGPQMSPGLEHLPGQVDRSMAQTEGAYVTMAQELLWLSRVVPPMLAGNAQPYLKQDTQARQIQLVTYRQMQAMCPTNPVLCQLTKDTWASMKPVIEQEVFAVATGKR